MSVMCSLTTGQEDDDLHCFHWQTQTQSLILPLGSVQGKKKKKNAMTVLSGFLGLST